MRPSIWPRREEDRDAPPPAAAARSAETARIARAAFPKGHPYLCAADELGAVFTDRTFASLFPHRGQPASAPWRLALATILQLAEGLSGMRFVSSKPVA
jgi:transposase